MALVYTRHEFQRVFDIYVPIALGIFAAVIILVGFALFRYRRADPARAARWHEHNPLEGGYAIVLTCIVAFLLYITFSAEHQTDTVAREQHAQLTVNVFGAKWEWHFEYPAYGISRYSGTVGHETLVLPTNEAIRFRLISRDVIHEFWVPELRYKHDLFPDTVQTVTLAFSRTGRFSGQCAEFCGLYHSRMTFTVEAITPTHFAAWVAGQRRTHAASGARP